MTLTKRRVIDFMRVCRSACRPGNPLLLRSSTGLISISK